jgi:dipeptidyl aminopeptidase/acylaminoacyl peptidase
VNSLPLKSYISLVCYASIILYFVTNDSEFILYLEWDLGLPWQDPELYAKWSPDSYVQNWKTPTFVIHGGKDYRVPETEGIATFTALQRLGVPSQFLYFEDEGHWVLKADNSAQWYNAVIAWLKKWLE